MRVHFSSKAFDYQTLRALAYAPFGGSEVGEVLTTVERITNGDTDAWFEEWYRTAALVERAAEDAHDAGRERTAGHAYHRAHTYYRTAEFFLSADDHRRSTAYGRAVETFRSGLDALAVAADRLSIPYEDTRLPGYLFTSPDHDGPRPTVVCLGGFDSLGEELYFLCGVPEALARGYTVVVFEGPGQGAPLREQGLTARPDWEHVVGPVLDETAERPEVDADRIALVGVSFGGYYAPRAAAFDDRVAACIAFDHMHDLWRAAAVDAPRLSRAMLYAPDSLVNGLARLGERVSVDSRWLMDNSRWVFGIETAADLQRTLREYSLTDEARRIDCPTLVLAGEDDHFVPVELADEFVALVGTTASRRVFRGEEGAAEHCQVGNLTLATDTIYDWLDETLAAPERPDSVENVRRR
ncbi:alpha/beta hydrolase family protein [Halomarina oriensis]|uniref:Alpha/beta fold hydrolase n=1 Tax=Halomarina oriensis TaxID=671145 RepID=A0A6B0GS78_9EURY|nr:alpha/beta fold hydrolase [Halomarina oriensis]MWG36167.1 alpha/beta fold hydrolase [Halomarina oriensis]